MHLERALFGGVRFGCGGFDAERSEGEVDNVEDVGGEKEASSPADGGGQISSTLSLFYKGWLIRDEMRE